MRRSFILVPVLLAWILGLPLSAVAVPLEFEEGFLYPDGFNGEFLGTLDVGLNHIYGDLYGHLGLDPDFDSFSVGLPVGLEVIGITEVNRSATDQWVSEFVAEKRLTYPILKADGTSRFEKIDELLDAMRRGSVQRVLLLSAQAVTDEGGGS